MNASWQRPTETMTAEKKGWLLDDKPGKEDMDETPDWCIFFIFRWDLGQKGYLFSQVT